MFRLYSSQDATRLGGKKWKGWLREGWMVSYGKSRCLQGGRLVAKGAACKLWRRERDGGKELGGGMEG